MKNKGIAVLTSFILISILFSPTLLAAKIEINSQQNEIEAGEEITLQIKVEDIEIEEGINSFQGQIVYDKNYWEEITSEDITGQNNWSIVYNEEGTSEGKFILINLGEGITTSQNLFNITLKSKKKIITEETEIKLINLYTTDGEEMIPIQETSKTINIQGNQEMLIIAIAITIILIVVLVIVWKKYKGVKTK